MTASYCDIKDICSIELGALTLNSRGVCVIIDYTQGCPTPFLLCASLLRRQPPVLVSITIAKHWLRLHAGVRVQSRIENADELERDWGSSIREYFLADVDPIVLARWMLTTSGVSVPSRVCETWLARDWATAGGLVVCHAVEEQLGERLRLEEFRACFVDYASAKALSEVLRERQPPVRVPAHVLCQWYSKYHPDSPTQRYHTSCALEDDMGDDLRRDYAGLGYQALQTALGKRRKIIQVSASVCRRWVQQYSAAAPQAAAAAGAASSSGIVTQLIGAKEVEEVVGVRYRKEVTDLGLGLGYHHMKARLRTWGYEVSREACQDLLTRNE